jgi:hypothetical protein
MSVEIKTIYEQKTFNISKYPLNEKQIVTSGGVLIYRFNQDEIELLMINSRGGYEDFGGKIDCYDKNIFKTVSRETYEESNNLIDKKQLESRLVNAPYIYVKNSKYVCFIVEATPEESNLTSYDFGDVELHDNIKRTVKWIPLSKLLTQEVIKYKLNWRLKSSALFSKLTEINNQKKMCVSMFR